MSSTVKPSDPAPSALNLSYPGRRGRVLLGLDLNELAVEALQNFDGALHRLEPSLRVGESLVVRGLVLLAERGLLRKTLRQIRHLLRQDRDVLRQRVGERRLLHLQGSLRLNGALRLVPVLSGRLHLLVAPFLRHLLR